MKLIKHGRSAGDPWTFIPDDAPLPQGGQIIVTLARWRSDRVVLMWRSAPVGLRLRGDEEVESISADLNRFGVIALEFPTFRDGRAYSKARLLRERYGYKGELRAVGNVLRDQLLFMTRCGFDAFVVEKAEDAEAWREAIEEISVAYQPAGNDRTPAALFRRSRETGTRPAANAPPGGGQSPPAWSATART